MFAISSLARLVTATAVNSVSVVEVCICFLHTKNVAAASEFNVDVSRVVEVIGTGPETTEISSSSIVCDNLIYAII